MSQTGKDVFRGVSLALILYVLVLGVAAPTITVVRAAPPTLFSMTFLVPNNDPTRMAYAAMIANSFDSVGISVSLKYMSLSDVASSLFTTRSYDAGFVGWLPSTVSPDVLFSNVLGNSSAFAPSGYNYYLYNNSVVNSLIAQALGSINATLRQQDLWQIESLLQGDSPMSVIYYTEGVVARSPSILEYGSSQTFSANSFPDVEHLGGVTNVTLALASAILPSGNFNPTTSLVPGSETYAVMSPLFSPLQEWNPVTNSYNLDLATSINVTSDGLHWTIGIRSSTWTDGANVTADDFVFALEADFLLGSAACSLRCSSSWATWRISRTLTGRATSTISPGSPPRSPSTSRP